MKKLPFTIPKSLASYLEQYDKHPEKTIKRFNKQLQKRESDAVGFFLLGWLYYKQGNHPKAIELALKTKILAPGSPFFQKLHYFFSHPDLFDAWYKPASYSSPEDKSTPEAPPLPDLDLLIEKLSQMEPYSTKFDTYSGSDSNFKVDDYNNTDDMVSETLANVHERQGNYEAAINIYQKLKKAKKDNADFHEQKIAELREALKRKEEE